MPATLRAAARVATLALGLALPPLAAAPAQDAPRPTRARTTYEDLQLFGQVLNLLRVNHADSVSQHALIMGAIRGMLAAADPHSYVVEAVRMDPAVERAYREGKLLPVPVQFALRDGVPTVVGVAPGSEAARADVLPGDELASIDGAPVRASSEFELELLLAGPKHSRVTLGLARQRLDGSRVRVERSVRRERPSEQTAVPAAFLLDAQTGYVRVTTFDHARVAEDVHDALGRLEKAGMRRLVLDLRDNGGGVIREAAAIAGEFLPRGDVVYTQAGRKPDVVDTGRVGRSFWSRERRYPIVVLVNAGTASAAELVAGALQDHDRALVVGRPSFGKSLVMQGFPVADGSLAVLVVGRVRTPCGRMIQRDYRDVERQRYYRDAAAARDTVGRPSCRTDAGRVVYGGGGIYPDLALAEPAAAPVWLARLSEEGVLLAWAGAHLAANPTAYASLDALAAAPALAPGAVQEVRRLATAKGLAIPEGADVDAALHEVLLRRVADARWSDAGYYRIAAVLDPEVRRALEGFERAAALLR
jgi:carboxyl-terminal processing protease